MNRFFILLTITLSASAWAKTDILSEKQICRNYYLELIKVNPILKNLRGGEQVHFFLQPKQIVKKYHLDLEQDDTFKKCSQ